VAPFPYLLPAAQWIITKLGTYYEAWGALRVAVVPVAVAAVAAAAVVDASVAIVAAHTRVMDARGLAPEAVQIFKD